MVKPIIDTLCNYPFSIEKEVDEVIQYLSEKFEEFVLNLTTEFDYARSVVWEIYKNGNIGVVEIKTSQGTISSEIELILFEKKKGFLFLNNFSYSFKVIFLGNVYPVKFKTKIMFPFIADYTMPLYNALLEELQRYILYHEVPEKVPRIITRDKIFKEEFLEFLEYRHGISFEF